MSGRSKCVFVLCVCVVWIWSSPSLLAKRPHLPLLASARAVYMMYVRLLCAPSVSRRLFRALAYAMTFPFCTCTTIRLLVLIALCPSRLCARPCGSASLARSYCTCVSLSFLSAVGPAAVYY